MIPGLNRAAIISALVLLPALAEAACQFNQVRYCDGCTADVYLIIDGTTRHCIYRQTLSGGIIGMDVVERPRSGSVARHTTALAYTRDPAFRGSDAFSVRVNWRSQHSGQKPLTTLLKFHVTAR